MCPLLSKTIDKYIVQLNEEKWNGIQAETQYQGKQSSHELAAINLIEAINHQIYIRKEPIYLLFLDALSAFNRVIPFHAIKCAYFSNTIDQGLVYLNNRIQNRKTVIQWGQELLGPINDSLGVEQGAIPSDKLYRLINNEQLKVAQSSQLGINMGLAVINGCTVPTKP